MLKKWQEEVLRYFHSEIRELKSEMKDSSKGDSKKPTEFFNIGGENDAQAQAGGDADAKINLSVTIEQLMGLGQTSEAAHIKFSSFPTSPQLPQWKSDFL